MIYLFNDTEINQWGLKEKNEKFMRIYTVGGNPNFGIDIMKDYEGEVGFIDEYMKTTSSINPIKLTNNSFGIFYDYKHFSPFIKPINERAKFKSSILLLSVNTQDAHISNIFARRARVISHNYSKNVLNLVLSIDVTQEARFVINYIANDESSYSVIHVGINKYTDEITVHKFTNKAPLLERYHAMALDFSDPETHHYKIRDFRPNKPINTVIYDGEFEEVVKESLTSNYRIQDFSKFNMINLSDEDHRKLLKDCLEIKHITAATYYVDRTFDDLTHSEFDVTAELQYLDKFKTINILTKDGNIMYPHK